MEKNGGKMTTYYGVPLVKLSREKLIECSELLYNLWINQIQDQDKLNLILKGEK